MKRVGIIGGGASGLIAAIQAARKGAAVTLFEKQKKIGRKLLATGNGRCNITNTDIDVSHYHGHNPRFVNNVFARFGLQDTIDFFRGIGLPLVEGEEGKLYPASLQASSVLDVLEYETRKLGVTISLHRRVDAIRTRGDHLLLETAGRERHEFERVILSAGSCAYSPLGASRSGYELAESLGHGVHEPFPAILPITIPLRILHRLQGIKWEVGIEVLLNGKTKSRSGGEILFTAYGISGPAALDVSRAANELVLQHQQPVIVIDLFPGMTEEDLRERLEILWTDGDKGAAFSLQGTLPRRMPQVLLEMAGIQADRKSGALTPAERGAVLKILKRLTIQPGRPRDFSEAVAAAGGIDVNEINGATMESKIKPGVYITGEVLDIDGESGGYNLQFAWSTGAIAGASQC
ncbi:MAG: NAD(P)/FAD-dependent oxidoreductase [Spirochaetes bacterium]|nr:NAD(P)/FAD-dependent oxidoreductase [Spirochaetota bacterium]